MKRIITKTDFGFIKRELEHNMAQGLISQEQKDQILAQYEIKEGLNFIRVVVTVGAILIGLGILSFIASNWDGMTKLAKLTVIFGLFIGINLAGYKLGDNHPKTGRSLIYLGTLVYGAGIFLIGQMFNFGGDFTTAFLLWSAGIVPMAFQQQDKYIMLFANILFAVYLNGSVGKSFPVAAVVVIPVIYFAVHYFKNSRLLLFFANLTVLNFILHLAIRYDLDGIYTTVIFFVIGLLMYFIKHSYHKEIFMLQGNLLFGVAGVVLTVPDIWDKFFLHSTQVSVSVGFAIVFAILLFALVRTGSLISLLFICITIFRYYVDTFDFLPKSLFFVVGGLLLLGFGYYFERMRKAQGGGIEE